MREPKRGRRIIAWTMSALLATTVVLGSCWVVISNRDSTTREDKANIDAPPPTTEVAQRKTLDKITRAQGTLEHETSTGIILQRGGTVTMQPPSGTVIDLGQELCRIDNTPVTVFRGSVPAWRELTPGIPGGVDIAQLKQAMIDHGFVKASAMPINNEWKPALTRAVKSWQKSLGIPQTGVIALGDIFFHPEAMRIGVWEKPLGALVVAGDSVARTSRIERSVMFALDVTDRPSVSVGKEVHLEFADGTTAVGSVGEIIADNQSGEDSGKDQESESEKLKVRVTVAQDSVATQFDGASVRVSINNVIRENVLAVPITAIVALVDGGFGVQVQNSDGSLRYVAVVTGVFVDTWVEITGGDLLEGDRVVVTP